MKKKKSVLLTAALVAGLCLSFGAHSVTAFATDIAYESLNTQIVGMNNEELDHGNSLVFELSQTDYITAEFGRNEFGGIIDYKWLNCEDEGKDWGFASRYEVDLAQKNFCNIPMEYNLDDPYFNMENYIFIDGVSLAEFSQKHEYKMFGNKRTRVNTLSLDFAEGVVQSISQVEIREGCMLPTMQYAYLNEGDPAFLYVTETVLFNRLEGKWTDFTGYEEGVKYAGTDKVFEKNLDATYLGHKATPLDSFTEFFKNNEIQGEKLDHTALSSSSDTKQGYIMVLNLDFPIDAREFNKINLCVYTNFARKLRTYNVNDVTEGSLGESLEELDVGGGLFSIISLSTPLYADENGKVSTIVFEFVDDGKVEADGSRHQFFFVSFHLSNEPLLTKDSFLINQTENTYELTLRFNKTGKADDDTALDKDKVLINGVSVADIQKECADAIAYWRVVHGVYQIDVRLPKAYAGAAQIKNPDYNFVGNSMCVQKGLTFPNGEVLGKSYTAHIYEGEKILDSEMATQFKPVEVQAVWCEYVDDSQNMRFVLYFDQQITFGRYNHACEKETWRESELTKFDGDLYDAGISQIFVDGGYKSSLLDSVLINGKTIGEMHAYDNNSPTNVQIHYAGVGLNCVEIIIEKASPNTYNELDELVRSGNGVTIEIKAGWKFISGKATAETQKFVLQNGAFRQVQAESPLEVYFNGVPVEAGDTVVLSAPASEKSLAVKGVSEYQVKTKPRDGGYTVVTITYGDGESFVFQVKGELTSSTPTVETVTEEVGGCSSAIGGISTIGAALLIVAIVAMKGGKKYEEN